MQYSYQPDDDCGDILHSLGYCQEDDDDYEEAGQGGNYNCSNASSAEPSCSQGHRSTLLVQTSEGGAICLLCFGNLVSVSTSPALHVSYALSQLSRALSDPTFRRSLITFHSHLLIPSLVTALSIFDDDSIATQATDLIVRLCDSDEPTTVLGEFVRRISDQISSGVLGWSRPQLYTLHCLGILLNFEMVSSLVDIKEKDALVSNLLEGLRLPCEEIRGEILFVLYRLSMLIEHDMDFDIFLAYCPEMLCLPLEAMRKTENDDVRANCVAFLTVLAQRGFFEKADFDGGNGMDCEASNCPQSMEERIEFQATALFADAIKGPLLSSNSQVQIGTLDLIFYYLSGNATSTEKIQVLIDENIADYAFEILRLSNCKDPMVTSCLRVLDLLSTAERSFRQRLAIGFTTLLPVLQYVAEVPFHQAQPLLLKLIRNSLDCPGLISNSHMEEVAMELSRMLKRHTTGNMGIYEETFVLACSVFVSLMASFNSNSSSDMAKAIMEMSEFSVISCMNSPGRCSSELLHTMHLLKTAFVYGCQASLNDSSSTELRSCLIEVCKNHLLPWLATSIYEMEDEILLAVLETLHVMLVESSNIQALQFADILMSSSWFSLSFACLGLFSSDKVRWRVYMMLSSVIDVLRGADSGKPIRDSALTLPSDPYDLLYLLGQNNSQNQELSDCQDAVLLVLETCSLYGERLADEKAVLASLEQYILVNRDALEIEVPTKLLNLYGLYRGLGETECQGASHSPDAERILFLLMMESDWDFLSVRFHMTSLKWLFQQEVLVKLFSEKIMRFCSNPVLEAHNPVSIHGANSRPGTDFCVIAELVATEECLGATVFVYLLNRLMDGEWQEYEVLQVVSCLARIISLFPVASNHLCSCGLGTAMRNFSYNLSDFGSCQIRITMLHFTFKILRLVSSAALCNSEGWEAVTMKLVDYLSDGMDADCWTMDGLFSIGILCLILHHSINGVFDEAAKIILVNTSLAPLIRGTLDAACSKESLLVEEKGRLRDGALPLVLLLSYFAFKSCSVVLPGIIDWQALFNPLDGRETSWISIHCKDLCRLVYFGSPAIKLISSCCLAELFTKISEQAREGGSEVNCSIDYLTSVMSILEGMVFCPDVRVAVNCGLCLSMAIGWETVDAHENRLHRKENWCRLIVEELAMNLAVPRLVSKSFTVHHKAAAHVAVALLKLERVPPWMKAVFDHACISGIIKNSSPQNMSAEVVSLFQELLKRQCLTEDHIADLHRVLQACRERVYSDAGQREEDAEDVIENGSPDDSGEICEHLLPLMLRHTCPHPDECDERLLDEIEGFSRSLAQNARGNNAASNSGDDPPPSIRQTYHRRSS